MTIFRTESLLEHRYTYNTSYLAFILWGRERNKFFKTFAILKFSSILAALRTRHGFAYFVPQNVCTQKRVTRRPRWPSTRGDLATWDYRFLLLRMFLQYCVPTARRGTAHVPPTAYCAVFYGFLECSIAAYASRTDRDTSLFSTLPRILSMRTAPSTTVQPTAERFICAPSLQNTVRVVFHRCELCSQHSKWRTAFEDGGEHDVPRTVGFFFTIIFLKPIVIVSTNPETSFKFDFAKPKFTIFQCSRTMLFVGVDTF